MTNKQQTDAKLLNCPFCGGKAELQANDVEATVSCKECNAEGPYFTFGCDSSGMAIEAWNSRFETDMQPTTQTFGAFYFYEALLTDEQRAALGMNDDLS